MLKAVNVPYTLLTLCYQLLVLIRFLVPDISACGEFSGEWNQIKVSFYVCVCGEREGDTLIWLSPIVFFAQ